jgi:hypothetical protein
LTASIRAMASNRHKKDEASALVSSRSRGHNDIIDRFDTDESHKKMAVPQFQLDDKKEDDGTEIEMKPLNKKKGKKIISKKNDKEKDQKSSSVFINIDKTTDIAKRKRQELTTSTYQSLQCGKDEEWNMGVQIMLMKIGEKAMGYRWMHNQQKEKLDKSDARYRWAERLLLGFIMIISGTITLLTSIGLNDNLITILITGALNITLLFLYGIIKETHESSDVQAQIYRNEQDSRKYGEIHLEIQKQLALRVKDRRNDKEFLTQMVDKYNDVYYQASILDSSVSNKYLIATKKRDISLPINFTDDGKVRLYVNSNDNNGLDIEEGRQKPRRAELGLLDMFDAQKRYNYELTRYLREF